MRNLFSVLPFVALSFFCWGIYGPILHDGQYAMGADGVPSSLRPLICGGIAYFIIAVLFPIGILKTKGKREIGPPQVSSGRSRQVFSALSGHLESFSLLSSKGNPSM